MAEDMGEKTELPTGRRIQDARDKGQVAKSTDLAAAIELIAAVILLAVLGGFMVRTLHTIMLESLAPSASSIMTGELLALVRSAGGQALIIAALSWASHSSSPRPRTSFRPARSSPPNPSAPT